MRRSLNLFAGAALMFAATAAQAQIVGTFNAAGSATYSGTAAAVGVNPSTFIIALPTLDGIFAPIAPGTNGTMAPVVVGNGAFAVPAFITVAGYTFSLTSIAPTSFSSAQCGAVAAVGQTCGTAGSGFNWTNNSNGTGGISSAAAFSFSGVVTTPSAQTYNYNGIYSAQFVNRSYQQVLSGLGTTRAPDSYSLNIQAVSNVPEPATVALMGTGLLALAGIARRRRSSV